VKIRSFAHKGLKRLYTEDSAKGVPSDIVDKLLKIFAYLENMEDPEELRTLTAWKAHALSGDRKGTWSLSVTGNRRLTFRIDAAQREILRREFRGLSLTTGVKRHAHEEPTPSR